MSISNGLLFPTTNLPAELLELEITENVVFQDLETALPLLKKIKEIGVRIAIDDFVLSRWRPGGDKGRGCYFQVLNQRSGLGLNRMFAWAIVKLSKL